VSRFPEIGLVIQGQVQSRGRGPLASTLPHSQVSPSDIIHFDASGAIRAQLQLASRLFGVSCCVTWETEDCSQIQDLVDGGSVIRISDNTKFVPGTVGLLPVNNKYRQFLSTLYGISHCVKEKPSIKYILKVRTDQVLDLEKLANDLINAMAKMSEGPVLVVPAIMPGMAAGIHDFYFGGKVEVMTSVCEYMVDSQEFEFCRNVHTDLMGRLALRWVSPHLDVASRNYFLRDGLFSPHTSGQCLSCAEMWHRHLATFSRSVWETAVWRGKKMHRAYYPDNIYSEDSAAVSKFINELKGRVTKDSALRGFCCSCDAVNWVKWLRWRFGWGPAVLERVEQFLHDRGWTSLPRLWGAVKGRIKDFLPPVLISALRGRRNSAACVQSEESEALPFSFTSTDANALAALYDDYFLQESYKFVVGHNAPRIIDCGANVGVSVRYWKKLFPLSGIVAFECDPGLYQILLRNTADLPGVVCVEGAVWVESGHAEFRSNCREGGHLATVSSGANDGNVVVVKTHRLRDLLREHVDLLKIDIEGAEVEVLLDCADLLCNVDRIFVEHHSFVEQPQRLADFFKVLEAAGFRLHVKSGLGSRSPFLGQSVFNGKDMYLNVFAFRTMSR
jgi:FkbM family methyltransferase